MPSANKVVAKGVPNFTKPSAPAPEPSSGSLLRQLSGSAEPVTGSLLKSLSGGEAPKTGSLLAKLKENSGSGDGGGSLLKKLSQ